MTEPCCPECGSKLKRGRCHRRGGNIIRYRNCTQCDYGDKTTSLPEVLLRVEPVFRRRKRK